MIEVSGGIGWGLNWVECRRYEKIRSLRCEVAASAAVFYLATESFGGPSPYFVLISLLFPLSAVLLSIRYSIPTQEVGNALVTPLGSRASIGDGERRRTAKDEPNRNERAADRRAAAGARSN
ncbi:hypothetical protein EVAR_36056_1 [Eumeta japonica]|uniref:Uncharacterized protein n=1 Tax=Eumeta variegata TaxID=151549 RepID=A0A4C1WQB8_EUMVA|nr:hypothetical protein EVAR_36056_1 [Eumeta japonica]